MSITRINTNTDAMMASANLRKLEFSLSRTMSHLSTGLRLVVGSDDPSGVGLMGTFKAQLSGTRMAIQNAEDALSLMQLADTALTDISDVLIRMRDLSVRAATDATMTTGQREALETEFVALRDEIDQKMGSVSFNTKAVFDGTLSTATVQIGPDNLATQIFSIKLPQVSNGNINGISITACYISTGTVATGPLSSLSVIGQAIGALSELQAKIGAREKEVERIITELGAAEVNVAAAASRITDADMALEVSNFAKQQVISMAATAMIAQANAQPQQILSLLGVGG